MLGSSNGQDGWFSANKYRFDSVTEYKVVRLDYLGIVTLPARKEIDGTTQVRFLMLPQKFGIMEKSIRFNYTITDDGIYVGYVVNHEGVIAQANSLEELEKRLKLLLKSWLQYWVELNNDPETKFELLETDV